MPLDPPHPVPPPDELAPLLKGRMTTAELVANALRERLVAGVYGPGTPMRESVLAPALGVSRPTMREALQQLVREGLLTHHLHRGMVVAELGPDDVGELYLVRLVLETGGVAAAAAGDGVVDAASVMDACATLETVAAGEDGMALVNADMAFHAALVALSGSRRLVDFHASAFGQLRLALSRFDLAYGALDGRLAEHRQMATLLEEGRYEELQRELVRHLRDAAERVAEFVAEAGARR